MLVARRGSDPEPESGAPAAPPAPPRPAYAITPLIAIGMLAVTLAAGGHYGIGLRDPDGVVGSRLLLVLALIFIFCALDVVPRAILDARATSRPALSRIVAIAHARWSWRRLAVVLGSIVAFYVIYLCYRNVKSYLPLARPELFDSQLAEVDRSLFGGDPAAFLHQLLGTGVAAHVLSSVYLLFLTFVPISVVVTLVWSSDTATGLWWVNVLSLNWVLGALSYFLMPSMGPAFVSPELFAGLPQTGASSLQNSLLEHRQAFLQNPVGSGELQSIAAFASLHVAIVFSAALMAELLRMPRVIRAGLWAFLALTVVATIYFGWHYVVDDIAGFVIGSVSVYAGARLTGWRIARTEAATALRLRRA